MIVGRHGHVVLLGVFCHQAFDHLIGAALLPRVEDLHTSGAFLFLGGLAPSIKDRHHASAAGVLICGEPLNELLAGRFHMALVEGSQLRPGKDHAMRVDEQKAHAVRRRALWRDRAKPRLPSSSLRASWLSPCRSLWPWPSCVRGKLGDD